MNEAPGPDQAGAASVADRWASPVASNPGRGNIVPHACRIHPTSHMSIHSDGKRGINSGKLERTCPLLRDNPNSIWFPDWEGAHTCHACPACLIPNLCRLPKLEPVRQYETNYIVTAIIRPELLPHPCFSSFPDIASRVTQQPSSLVTLYSYSPPSDHRPLLRM